MRKLMKDSKPMGIGKNKCHQMIILMQLESLSKLFVYYGKEREDYVETRV